MVRSADRRPDRLAAGAAQGIVWTALQSWGVQVLSLLVFLVLARVLEPRAFGVVALATVFLQLAQILVDQGLAAAIIQRQSVDDDHLDTAFWMNAAVGAAFTIGTLLGAAHIARLFREPAITPVLHALSLLFLASSMSAVHEALLARAMQFKRLAIRSLISTAVAGVIGVTLALRGHGVMSLVGYELAGAVAGTVLIWHASAWRPRFRFSAPHYRELLGFSAGMLGVRIMNYFSRRSDDLLVGRFLGSVALGYYGVAYKIFKVFLDMFAKIISRVALPMLSRAQTDLTAFRSALRGFLRLSGITAFPVFVTAAALAPTIVRVAFGARWAPAGEVMRVLAGVGVAQALSLVLQQGILAAGRPGLTFRILTISAGVTVAGFASVVSHGIVAVATVYAVVGWALIPVYSYVLHRLVGFTVRDLVLPLRVPVLGSVALLGAVAILDPVQSLLNPAAGLAVSLVGAAATYTGVVHTLDPTVVSDLRAMISNARRKGERPARRVRGSEAHTSSSVTLD